MANEILHAGRHLTAEECLRWGLAKYIASQGQLMDTARALASRILNPASLSVVAAKQTTCPSRNMLISLYYGAIRRGDSPVFVKIIESEDSLEGTHPTLKKRAPFWTGR